MIYFCQVYSFNIYQIYNVIHLSLIYDLQSYFDFRLIGGLYFLNNIRSIETIEQSQLYVATILQYLVPPLHLAPGEMARGRHWCVRCTTKFVYEVITRYDTYYIPVKSTVYSVGGRRGSETIIGLNLYRARWKTAAVRVPDGNRNANDDERRSHRHTQCT